MTIAAVTLMTACQVNGQSPQGIITPAAPFPGQEHAEKESTAAISGSHLEQSWFIRHDRPRGSVGLALRVIRDSMARRNELWAAGVPLGDENRTADVTTEEIRVGQRGSAEPSCSD
jgi:hypothetical protein